LGLNYITLLGEVISSPEKKHTLEGLVVATFNVSFNTNSEDIINKHSIKISATKKLADKVISEVDINDKIILEGRLLTKIIEEKGFKHKIPYIQLNNFHIVEKYNIEIPQKNIEEEKIINEDEIPF
jgi:single-stranded DNA-binding protein